MKYKNLTLLGLTIWAVAGSYVTLFLVGIANFTNQWIFTKEIIDRDFSNGTLRVTVRLHSGLLEFCRDKVSYIWIGHPSFTAVKNVSEATMKTLYAAPDDPGCFNIRASLPEPSEPPKDISSAVLQHVVKVLPLPICSFLLLVITSSLSTMGLFFPQRRCFMFLTGAGHILAGLCSLTGLIRYIIAVNDAVIEKHPVSPDKLFMHTYGISFVFAVLAFFLINSTGVASLYLYIRLEKMAVRSEQDRYRHQFTMSSCVTSSPDIEITAHDDGENDVVDASGRCGGGGGGGRVVDDRTNEGNPLRPRPEGIDSDLHIDSQQRHYVSYSDNEPVSQPTSIEL
ncbi:uncharacterized protein LOC129269814 [Lytechinus pictus]|uniref:uncharacterized protein LOC129269814 n=1 Tax=Lytechinus pictus TaxID=7653 RepID=UPI0030BA1E9D